MFDKEATVWIFLLLIVGCNAIEEQPLTASSPPTRTQSSYDTLSACRQSQKKEGERGEAAAKQGNYQEALRIWRQAAAEGNPYAKIHLCIFHMTDTTPKLIRF